MFLLEKLPKEKAQTGNESLGRQHLFLVWCLIVECGCLHCTLVCVLNCLPKRTLAPNSSKVQKVFGHV